MVPVLMSVPELVEVLKNNTKVPELLMVPAASLLKMPALVMVPALSIVPVLLMVPRLLLRLAVVVSVSVPELLMVPAALLSILSALLMVPELLSVPTLLRITSEEILSISPLFTVRELTLQNPTNPVVITSSGSQVPPIATQEASSEIVPPTANTS